MVATGTTGARTTKRFARKQAPPNMVLTERDIAILRGLIRFRFLTSTQIQLLDSGSYASVMRLMRTLYDNGFVDVPTVQIADLVAYGNGPNVYALSSRGAKALAAYEGGDIDRLRWSLNNARLKPRFIRHTTGIASVMVPLLVACRDDRAPNLIDHHDLVPLFPAETQRRANPFLWKATVQDHAKAERIALVPDRLFSLMFADSMRLNFALELDTGEMPVARRSMKGTSIKRKLLGYLSGWRSRAHEEWGFTRLRVLLVTSSRQRIATMQRVLDDITDGRGSGMFLFATLDDIEREGPLASIWETGKAERISLVS